MIQYDTITSPFFEANKHYCETIENQLKTINLDSSGFCNSFGYDIETVMKKGNMTYNLKFHKHQSTQNGIIIPVDALDYAGLELTVNGLDKKYKVVVGQSSFRRLFTPKKFKDKIPKPYFMKFNYTLDSNEVDNLAKKIRDNKISKFELSNGVLVCKMHTNTTDLLNLIDDIENTTKNWV